MQQLLDQIAEQLPVADEEPTDASDLRRDSAAVASQMPSAAEAAEWATAGKSELEATPLSLASIRAQAKTILAAKTTPVARQDTLAALAYEIDCSLPLLQSILDESPRGRVCE